MEMASEDQDDMIMQFQGITGVEPDRARFYLEASGWQIQVSSAMIIPSLKFSSFGIKILEIQCKYFQ